MSAWTSIDIDTLRRLYPTMSTYDVAKRMGKGYVAVRSKAKVLKLKKVDGFVRSPKALTSNEKQLIRKHYLTHTYRQVAKMIGRGESTVRTWMTKLGLKGKANGGRFQKGSVPWTKGKEMPPGWGGSTRFRKGQLPKNTKTDGYISVRHNKNRRPYLYIRIKQRHWRELHRVLWEKTMGPIPKGYNVQFKDGNQMNCVPSNLYLINRHNQIKQNTIHRYPPEVKELIRLSAKLKRKIKSYEKQD